MKKDDIYVFSKSENLRLYVLENAMHIEEIVSATIGFLLDVDWKTSKSFGNTASSLSFNQKILIIEDIKSSNNERIDKKTVLLMRIRNKFAHVKAIDSFENLFEVDNGNEIKNGLNVYLTNLISFENEEEKYKICFFFLVRDIAIIIHEIVSDHLINLSKRSRELLTNSYILDVNEELKKLSRLPKIF